MKTGLTLFSLAALAALVGVSIWATQHVGIAAALRDLVDHPTAAFNPWFVATLFDTYFAFLWFWLWVAYRETNWALRGLWLLLICGLGNIAMALYMLLALWRLPAGGGARELLLGPRAA